MMSIDDVISNSRKMSDSKMEREREEFRVNFGFDENGYTWIATENVIEEKARLEFRGKSGWYDRFLGWHSPHPIDGFRTVKVHMDEIAEFYNGRFITRKYKVDEIRRKAAEKNLTRKELRSKFVGEPGKEFETCVTLDRMVETPFKNDNSDIGGMKHRWEFYFNDEDGNIIKFASAWYDPKKVEEFCGTKRKKKKLHLKAKVYSHSNTYGTKETWITYPVISKTNGELLKDFARMSRNEDNERELNGSDKFVDIKDVD